ncbi:MAG: S-methyl-5-thioribose kinase, partial [Anaerolinea sp.]|nr:S-methyl-5-thioribose kinase [Anaerolinea sp.]
TLKSVFSDTSALTAEEVGDGNLNLVFIVRNAKNPAEAVVMKQALPYLRVAGDSWALTRERVRYEAQALRLYNELTPGLAPHVYDYDEEMSLLAMEYLGSHEVMRRPMVARKRFPKFADHLSTFLANILFKTSDLYLTGLAKKTMQATFINPHLGKIQEDFVFTNPYMTSSENKWNPEIDAEVQAVRGNAPLKLEIADLKAKFMTETQALIHSDLHTGSIMVNERDTRVIDPEFSFFGPMGYDIGAVLSNFVLNFASHYAHTPDRVERESYQSYLIETMRDLWTQFAAKFDALWVANNTGELVPNAYWDFPGGDQAFAEYRRRYIHTLLQDTAGLGACESLRRMMGIVSVWDITSITDNRLRAVSERFNIRVSTRWIMERKRFNSIEDMLGIMQEEAAHVALR